ncbi:MAG: MBOAT family protein [Oscillospiraceae bacterium]|nr:MBOAT family protein [Oscillospiraceae bacterium]
MLFSSNVFLFGFLPAVLLFYYLVPRKWKNPVLLLFSLLFYGWGEPVYLFLMIGVIALNYGCGILIHRFRTRCPGKILAAGVAANLLILGFFKYAGFLSAQLQILLPFLPQWQAPQIPLPIGISFYTFQSMSYIIDVYRQEVAVQRNPLTFGTYVTLFPQLIAGPIVRYSDVALQMDHRKESMEAFSSGILLFVVGLSKKVLLANPMGNLWNLLREQPGTLAAWIGIAAYTFQIYFDFSGYSDMARGLGRMFGFEFLENFRYPYISRSVTEFWRRWHISLSTWFREYVYIPLGGNRRGLARQILNLLIVWGLTGLWHGASWNFVLWGLYYAVLLILEKAFLLKRLQKAPAALAHVYTIVLFMLGWALFYFEDMAALGAFLLRLFTPAASGSAGLTVIVAHLPLLLAAALGSTPLVSRIAAKYSRSRLAFPCLVLTLAVLLLLCTASLASQSYNPFIYFRF